MKKFWLLFAGILLVTAITPPLGFAQNGGKYEVKGVVVDAQGVPVVGATVYEKGSANGTTTALDGSYVIGVTNDKAVIEFSFMGYKTIELVASSSVLNRVVMEEDAMALEDVLVIGYGTVKKTDATGSIATIKADQINKGFISSPTELMRGKSAGIVVTSGDGAPGSASTIRVRGGSSLKASNDPLVVIDGLPVANTSVAGVGDPLSTVNPSDIESFTVLKDASATAIYGSRASNGVIIITTKKGSKHETGVPRVSLDFTTSVATNTKYVDVLTGDQMRDAIRNWAADGENSSAYKALGNANTNWQKEIYRTAVSYDLNASITGNIGMGKHNYMPYRVGVGYMNQDGVLKTSNMERETVSLNLNPVLLDEHLNINLNGKFMNADNRFANQGAIGDAVRYDPTQPIHDENGLNGYYWWNNGKGTPTIDNCNTMANLNPLAELFDNIDVANSKRFVGNAQIQYKIHGLEDLSLNLNLGMDYVKGKGTQDVATGSEQSMHDKQQQGSGYHKDYTQDRMDQTLEAYLNYAKTIDKHSFGIMAGYSWQHFHTKNFEQIYSAEDNEVFIKNPLLEKTENFLVSFFGRVNYSYDDRYMVTATVRYDGTSRFKNNKWGLFPSVALGWNIAREAFLRDSEVLSALKLRLSWGQTGQQDVGSDYPSIATYMLNTDASQYIFGNTVIAPIKPQGYNEDLKWETTTTYNAGLDYGFLNGRIYGSIDYYYRKTTDLLNWTPVAAGSNLTNYLDANIGTLVNQGVEFDINAVAIQNKDWYWNIGFNVAYNKNKVTKMTTNDSPEYTGVPTGGISGGTGNNIQRFMFGYPVNTFYVYQQVYDEAGNPIEGAYVDRNEDGKIDDKDMYYCKKAAPDVTFGFNTQLSWKNLTLSVSAHANLGNWVYNNVKSNGELLSDLYTNNFVSNRVSSALKTNFASNAQYFSDYYLENASFLKLDNITLSYYIDLCKCKKLDRKLGLNVFATVQNVATWTKYSGLDPEVFSGIDNNMYPRPRTYIVGVKFNF